jgi:hypothetical protein
MAMQLSRTGTETKDTFEISNITLSEKRKYFKLNGESGISLGELKIKF